MWKSFLCVSFLILASCNGGDSAPAIPGSNLPALTAEQQVRLSHTSQDMSDVTAAASEHQVNQVQQAGNIAQAQPTLSEKGLQYEQEMNNSFQSAECVANQTGIMPDQTVGPNIPNFNFKFEIIDGANALCPFSFSTTLNTNTTVSQASQAAVSATAQINLESNFSAKENTPLYNNMDVYSFSQTFDANLAINGNQSGSNVNMTGTGKALMQSKSEGTIVNNLTLTMNASGNASQASVTLQVVSEYIFSDFHAVGVMKVSMVNQGQPAIAYYINGKSATEADFMKYFSPVFSESVLGQAKFN